MRPTLLFGLLALVACDSADDLRPIPEDMLVALTDDGLVVTAVRTSTTRLAE